MIRYIYIVFFLLLFSLSGNASTYFFVENDSLPDFVITNIEVVKRKKNVACVKYTLENQGTVPGSVLGPTNSSKDNLTIRAYLSGDKKLNRGDLLIDGTFVPNKFPNAGILKPDQTYVGEMKLDIRLKTKFINVLILNVDDLGKYKESNEANNFFSIIFY